MPAVISSSRFWWVLPFALTTCDCSDDDAMLDAGPTTQPAGANCYVALSKTGDAISIDELTVAGPKRVKAPGSGLTLVAQDDAGAELQRVEFGFAITAHGIGRDEHGNVTAAPSAVDLPALELPLDACERIRKLIVTDAANTVLAEKSF